jgi:hypothetical protein
LHNEDFPTNDFEISERLKFAGSTKVFWKHSMARRLDGDSESGSFLKRKGGSAAQPTKLRKTNKREEFSTFYVSQ